MSFITVLKQRLRHQKLFGLRKPGYSNRERRETAIQKYLENTQLLQLRGAEWVNTERIKLQEAMDGISGDANPKHACRELLCDYIGEMAGYWVLVMPPAPVPDISGFRGLPGVTGELAINLMEVVHADPLLHEECSTFKTALTLKQLRQLLFTRYQLQYLWIMVLNDFRISELGDYHPEAKKDWFMPLLHGMCAVHEDMYRNQSGMTRILSSENANSLVTEQYLILMSIVMQGHQYPYLLWLALHKSWIDTGDLQVSIFKNQVLLATQAIIQD